MFARRSACRSLHSVIFRPFSTTMLFLIRLLIKMNGFRPSFVCSILCRNLSARGPRTFRRSRMACSPPMNEWARRDSTLSCRLRRQPSDSCTSTLCRTETAAAPLPHSPRSGRAKIYAARHDLSGFICHARSHHDYRTDTPGAFRPLMPFIEWQPTPDRNVEVLNDTADLYRYFDCTQADPWNPWRALLSSSASEYAAYARACWPPAPTRTLS